jgi:diguanylate cyclase (GGDEF)-like protein
MPSSDRSSLRLALTVIVPSVLVFVGAGAAVVVSLSQMADAVDRTEVSLTGRSADAAVQAATRRLANTVRDYARWDDATRNLYGEPDATFVEENLGDSTFDPIFFDTVYLVESDGRDVVAFRHGDPTDISSARAFGPAFARMIAELPTDGRTFEARAGLVRGAWGLALVAVGPVVPVTADLPIPGGAIRHLAIAKAFDDDAVRSLGEDYLIEGLSLSGSPTGSANRTQVHDYDGNTIAWLTWSPRELGSEAQAGAETLGLSMLGLLGFLVMLLVAVAVHGVVRLQRKERDARHAATHDLLTGLPNRAALVARLDEAIRDLQHGGSPFAIAYLDLDGFKEVNDAYGHAAGDELLVTVAEAFRKLCGDRLLVRVGGDEFAVVVVEPHAIVEAVEIGQRLVDFFEERLEVDGHLVALSTSVGIVGTGSGEITVEEMLRRADVAMYRAKQLGRDRICVFETGLDAARARRTKISEDLQRALAAESLSLAYQPVFDGLTGRVVAAEALLRWPHQSGEVVSTFEFISIAEESGLIDEIGEWAMRRACRDALGWPDIRVAVNVSPAQFRNPDFASVVASVLADVGFPAERLEIEVTENFFIDHPDQARSIIDGLRRLGVGLALDDFGTGYSSIGYLRRFPFDKVKVDRALVAGIDKDPAAQQMLQATVLIGRALDLTVTAEGVETEAEALVLRAAGCHQFQGYYFARPESAEALTARLATASPLAQTG